MTTLPESSKAANPDDGVDDSQVCPECGAQSRIEDEQHGETVCAECGLVLDEGAIDPGPDWRAFDAQERDKRSRAGPGRTAMRHDHGLGTKIGYDEPTTPEKQARFRRLRRYQQRATYEPGADRNTARGLSEVKRLCGGLDLPDAVAETAARLYRQTQEQELLHGRSIEAATAGIVYAAARIHGAPRQLDEVVALAQAPYERVTRTYRSLNKELELPVPVTHPTDLIPAVASELGLTGPVREYASELVEKADETALVGKNPAGVAAAAIYQAAQKLGEARTQEEVAEAADVTAVTLRNRAKDLPDDVSGPDA
jgi:transcription initiation factor TFIIB